MKNLAIHIGVTRATILPTSAFLMAGAGLWGVLFLTIGPANGIGIAGSLLVTATIPGAAIVRRLFPRPSFLHYLVLGTVIGLGLLAVGGTLSHVTGIFLSRWIPSVLGLASWFFPKHRRISAHSVRSDFPVVGSLGSIAATVALIPALKTVLRSQPSQWTGWHQFYADLPFHVALTSEVAARSPEVYPWVAGSPLSYPWLYHSAMGVWASATNAAPADLILQVWPVLFAVLIPAVIALTGWEITRNKYVAMAAPLLYVLAHGLIFVPDPVVAVPLFQISPTRDFADFFILLALLSIARLLGRRSAHPASRWWLLTLATSTFVSTGSKGSAMPILLGGVLSILFFLLVTRRARIHHIIASAVFGAAAVGALVLTLPEPDSTQSLGWGPLSFLSTGTPNGTAISLVILGLLTTATVGLWVVIGRSVRGGWALSSLIAGVLMAGILGMGLLTHPADSQLYFWESAQPVLAIALAWAAVTSIRAHRRWFVVAVLSVFLVSLVAWSLTSKVEIVAAVIVSASVTASVLMHHIGRKNQHRRGRWHGLFGVLASAALLTQAAQLVSLPLGTPGGAASTSSDPSAIDESQLAAFSFILTHSSPDDLVVTNKHCLTAESDDCDGRWFVLTAWSERRTLVEGWAYTQHGASSGWVTSRLDLSKRFIASPSVSDRSKLIADGVAYVFVDRREGYSTDLSSIAKLVYSSKWANVYSLK